MGGAYLANQQVATDQEGVGISGSTGTAVARDEGVAISGTDARINNGGEFTASAGANSTVTVNDPAVLADALAALERSNETFSETVGNLASSSGSQNTGVLSAALAKLTDLAESKQTAGESGQSKTVLYIAIAGLAVMALFVWRRFR